MSQPISELPEPQELTLVHVFSALPSYGLSAVFLITWIAPESLGETMISTLMLIMLMEFINVHAAAFIGNTIASDTDRSKKAVFLVGLGLFYSLFVVAFAAAFEQWWPLWAFWGLMLNRLLGVLLGKAPTGQEKVALQTSWAIGVICYIMLVFATIILPVPALGITGDVVSRQGFSGGGLWEEEPQRVIAFGFLYFAAVGLAEMFSYKWTHQGGNPRRYLRWQ